MTATTETPPVTRRTVPAGYTIEFFTKPYRHYTIDGVEVISVTTALECLDKPALPWWGMTVGVNGLHVLLGMGVVVPTEAEGGRKCLAYINRETNRWEEATPEVLIGDSSKGIKGLLTQHQLTTNHVKSSAADRGQAAHDALEAWGVTGELPNPKDYSFEEEPYVRAVRDFLTDFPFEVEEQEVVVGSKEHGFAGRFDMRGKLLVDRKVVTKVYPKAKPKHVLMQAGRYLLDLKTSKDVYETHFLQLEAYEGASIECGYEPTDFRAVLQVGKDGRYQLRVVKDTTLEDYVQIVKTDSVMRRVKEALKV